MIILKSESKPDGWRAGVGGAGWEIMMMIKIWFRYTMNNEVFK